MARPHNLRGGRPRIRIEDKLVLVRLEREIYDQVDARVFFLNSNKTRWITQAILEKLARDIGFIVITEEKTDEKHRPYARSKARRNIRSNVHSDPDNDKRPEQADTVHKV